MRRSRAAPTWASRPNSGKAPTPEEIRQYGSMPTPGHYVGAEVQEEDDEPFAKKIQRLVAQLRE